MMDPAAYVCVSRASSVAACNAMKRNVMAQPKEAKERKKRRRRTAPVLSVNEDDRDLLDQYLYEVSKTPLLTAQQEIELAKKVRA